MAQWLGLGAVTAVAWVQSLVRELRSCKPCGVARKKKELLEAHKPWGEKLINIFNNSAITTKW